MGEYMKGIPVQIFHYSDNFKDEQYRNKYGVYIIDEEDGEALMNMGEWDTVVEAEAYCEYHKFTIMHRTECK